MVPLYINRRNKYEDGILIWHWDSSAATLWDYAEVEYADNESDYDNNKFAYDEIPSHRIFTYYSTPSSRLRNGNLSGVAIINIRNGGTKGVPSSRYGIVDVIDPTTYPAQPQGLSVTNSAAITQPPHSFDFVHTATSQLNWQANTEPDLDYYKIYKATSTGSEPGINQYDSIGTSSTNSANLDISDLGDNKKIYYRITAVDTEGKESVHSESNWDWAPPTAPSGFSWVEYQTHPKIKWNAKSFPNPKYDLYRKNPRKFDQWQKKVSNDTSTSYVDNQWIIYHTPGDKGFVKYKGVAKRQNKTGNYISSNFTSTLNVPVYLNEQKKSANKEDIPKVFALGQNYPNPFNPTTQIKYQLPKESNILIKLYDILGSEVAELVNDKQEAGYYELTLDGSQLSSGTYIYKITAGEFSDSKKLLLVK